MQIQVNIKNMDEVRAALLRSPVIVANHMNKAIHKSILEIRNNSRSTTPVRTETLRRSYQMQFSQLKGEIGPTVRYAYWVHEGHRQQVGRYVPAIGKRLVKPWVEGNPFLKKAVDMSEKRVNDFFAEGLRDALNEIASSV